MKKMNKKRIGLVVAVLLFVLLFPSYRVEASSKIDMTDTIVSDSGNYGGGYEGANTIDGNLSSRWAAQRPNSDYRGDYWLQYDFTEKKSIAEIVLYEQAGGDGNRITDVAVQISDDGKNWNEVKKFSDLKDNEKDEERLILDAPVSTEYLKLIVSTAIRNENGTERQGEPNVCEVEFYSEIIPEISDELLLKYYGITKSGVTLYWPALEGVKYYDIYQADAALGLTIDDMTKVNAEPCTDTSYQITGLEAGAEYRFMIVATMESGEVLHSNQANVPTAKAMNGVSLESGDNASLNMPYSSLALNMEYKGPTISDAGWFNWCVSPIKAEGQYHLFTSRWPDNMNNWTVKGQIIHSVADNVEGPYTFKEVILCDPELIDTVDESQRDTVITDLPGHAPHNCRIKKVGDQYALTFIMQTDGLNGVRGQKIALLVSDSVNGPWRWAGGEKGFVVEPSSDQAHWTYNSVVGTDNHDIIKVDDEYRIYFKAGPRQDATMHYGYAYSDTLEGPYTLCDEPALWENKNYIEDATVFEWNDTIYLLSTDNHGSNTGVLGYGVLWKSNDRGKTFRYADAKIGYGLIKDYIKWPVTGANDVYNGQTGKFERPAILMGDDGNPEYFFGTLGMNLDGNATAQNFMLKINWKPGSQKDLIAIGDERFENLGSEGTIENPTAASIALAKTELTLADIRTGGMKTELYADSNYTERFQDDVVKLTVNEETHVYIKVIAEDGGEAYYDISIMGIPAALEPDIVKVTDSGNYGGAYGPENTIDGDFSTRWAAQRPTNEYRGDFSIAYEYAEKTVFNRIKVYEMVHATDGNRIKGVWVQSSEDGINWEDVEQFEGLKDNGQDTETLDLEETLTTKYLQLVFSTDLRPEDQNRQAEPNVLEVELYHVPRTVAVSRVEISQKELKLKSGDKASLTANVFPENATNTEVDWNSSNEGVAVVDNGTVTAVGEGTAVITVITQDGNYADECTVIVEKEEDPSTPGENPDENDPDKNDSGKEDSLMPDKETSEAVKTGDKECMIYVLSMMSLFFGGIIVFGCKKKYQNMK